MQVTPPPPSFLFTLNADCSSSFKEWISCLRYWISDSLIRSNTWEAEGFQRKLLWLRACVNTCSCVSMCAALFVYLQFINIFALREWRQRRFPAETGAHPSDLHSQPVIQLLLDGNRRRVTARTVILVCVCVCVCVHADLVVSIKLLVLPLTLPQGLPLRLQGLGQVSVLQALLRVLLRQNLQLPLDGLQLLPKQLHNCSIKPNSQQTSAENIGILQGST